MIVILIKIKQYIYYLYYILRHYTINNDKNNDVYYISIKLFYLFYF